MVTGPRRCGKSWLLTRLYKDYLVADGVPEEDIIIVSLDMDDENNQSELADKEKLKAYLYSKITDPGRMYYVILDEIQEVKGFDKLVNGLRAKDNVDVYVTGSNAKLLSKDISTIFRDRGQEIRCNPFSFKEFCTGRTEFFERTMEGVLHFWRYAWNAPYENPSPEGTLPAGSLEENLSH